MAKAKKTFKVVGDAPVVVDSQTYRKDEEFDAYEKDVAYFLQIGAIEAKKG